MRSANAGDTAAYHRLLSAITPVLRAAARRGLLRAGQSPDQSEDIVQDTLLAVHLKRHTWDAKAPFAPWLFTIARNKLIDALRRRGRRVFVDIEAHLKTLPQRQRDVLQSISVDGLSITETAKKFEMKEGAVRVALHRGLSTLAARARKDLT